ncbi:MAG: hypothetical protein JWR42_1520, partial [Marmoricola sp.]|nr:hypothetical protein [Marmoricola sp.]
MDATAAPDLLPGRTTHGPAEQPAEVHDASTGERVPGSIWLIALGIFA